MGLCLFFLPNFPGATFIQGGTFIPDSRVNLLNYLADNIGQITNKEQYTPGWNWVEQTCQN